MYEYTSMDGRRCPFLSNQGLPACSPFQYQCILISPGFLRRRYESNAMEKGVIVHHDDDVVYNYPRCFNVHTLSLLV